MAFTVTARQSSPNAGTATANLVTASATPTANSLFLVCVGAQMDAFGTETLPVFATPTGGGLTYTKVDSHGDVTPGFLWGSTNGFWTGGAVYRAPVGGSPSAFAVTVDGASSGNAYHSAVCLDITGHNVSSPIVQTARNGARINPESSSTAGSVTLSSAPTAGNLIVVVFVSGTDAAGAAASPTAGAGKTFTTVTAQSPAFCTTGVFTRVADGTESTTITTADLGQLVGNYVAIAFEVAVAAPSSPTPSTVAATASVPSPTVRLGAVVAAAVVAASAVIPAPSVSTGSNATATPAVVSAVAAVPAATVRTGATAGPSTVAGVASIPAATVAAHRYVTGVSANGRYFVDQDGNPILIRGESPWAMFTDLSPSEMDTYLGNRASYGCNLMLVSMIGAVANGAPADTGATYDGVLPFVGGDPTVFNSTYWSRMDSYIAKARDLGITLMIYPMDGWNTAFASVVFNPGSISNAQCQTYGQTLATRYLSYPNIIWAFGGDYNEDATINARFNACLTGIRAAGDTRPCTIQLLYETSESHNSAFWEPKVNWDFVYTYYVTYKGVSDSYNHVWSAPPTARPALFSEGAYENSGAPHPGTDLVIRRQACWALTSGSPGELTGQEGVWQFSSGWASLLDTTAADQLKAIRDTFDALDWWTLVPDDANQLVTAGRGTRITTDSATFPSGNTYVTAARAADGSLAVIYLPNASSAITVDMTKIGANPTATWVDPTTGGTVTATPGSSYSRGNNAAGSTDWLLVLTGDAGVTATPATVTAAVGIPAPTVRAGATVAVSSVTGSASVPGVTLTSSTGVTLGSVAAASSVPAPTVTAGAQVVAVPVASVVSVPSPAVSAGGSATVAPTAVVAVVSVPAPTVTTGSVVTTGPVTAAVGVPTPTVEAGTGATATPVAVSCTAAVPAPAVGVAANPAAVNVTAGIPAPGLSTSSLVTATAVAVVAAVPAPAVATFVPVTERPFIGITLRPNTGTTTRP